MSLTDKIRKNVKAKRLKAAHTLEEIAVSIDELTDGSADELTAANISDIDIYNTIMPEVIKASAGVLKASIPAYSICKIIAQTIIRIKEAITKKRLLSVMVSEHVKKCIVRLVNHANNTVSFEDLETHTWTTVHGSSVSAEVQMNMVIET